MLNTDNIKLLFKNSSIEVNENHDETFKVFDNYLKKTKNKISRLVNFDTHSDLYQNYNLTGQSINIANWVNYCIKEFNLDEFYWIVPDYIYQNSLYRNVYQEKKDKNIINKPFINFDDEDIDLSKVNMRELYFNCKTGEIISPEIKNNLENNCRRFNMPSIFEKIPNLRKVRVYILTKQNIDILKGKEILLSVDADYFCNSGYDTKEEINNKYITKEDIINSFNDFTDTLIKAQIVIPSVSLIYSPIYILKNLRPEIENFYEIIKEVSNKN